MKKILLSAAVVALAAYSCSNKTNEGEEFVESNVMLKEPTEASADDASSSDPTARGQKLVEGADCMSCHQVDGKMVGPSFKEVAARYTAADTPMLIKKIIDGGAGNWGDVPMTPHAGMSEDNVKLMVEYVLAQK